MWMIALSNDTPSRSVFSINFSSLRYSQLASIFHFFGRALYIEAWVILQMSRLVFDGFEDTAYVGHDLAKENVMYMLTKTCRLLPLRTGMLMRDNKNYTV